MSMQVIVLVCIVVWCLFLLFAVALCGAARAGDEALESAIWVCDVDGCLNEVEHCDVGEGGDLWLCEDHWHAHSGDAA